MTADETPTEATAETEQAAVPLDAEATEATEVADGDGTVATEEPTQEPDQEAVEAAVAETPAVAKKRSFGTIAAVLVTLLVVASLGLLGWVGYFLYLPDRAVDDAASKAAVTAAKDGTVAVLSYGPDSLDHDLSNAKSHLTGKFLKYYTEFTDGVVRPAVKDKAVKTTAVVLRAALSEFHRDSAVALLFVNQSTQSKDRPEPTYTNSSVTVTLTKVDGSWLISDFTPI